ncbi:MAG: TauD/TfdA family dioxygenase, partial [Blastocatellia bacterium]
GKAITDPTARGNEVGTIGFEYHTDGSDLVGLMCLRKAKTGGLSCVANAVAVHNELVRTRPNLAALLYKPVPYDFRGEQPEGGRPFYTFPVFTEHNHRLFVRFIPAYIKASQRHPDAPRLTSEQLEAIAEVSSIANNPQFNVHMDLEPGDIQFINNYHVLHGRTAYLDEPSTGHKRHLKRLWLSTRYLTNRPDHFQRRIQDHWARNRSVSSVPAMERAR